MGKVVNLTCGSLGGSNLQVGGFLLILGIQNL